MWREECGTLAASVLPDGDGAGAWFEDIDPARPRRHCFLFRTVDATPKDNEGERVAASARHRPCLGCPPTTAAAATPALRCHPPVREITELVVGPGVEDCRVAVLVDGHVDVVRHGDGVPEPNARVLYPGHGKQDSSRLGVRAPPQQEGGGGGIAQEQQNMGRRRRNARRCAPAHASCAQSQTARHAVARKGIGIG